MYGTAWKAAREHAADKWAEAPHRVHDLKHTFGRRLRAAGVSFEDRQDLLGHKSGRITTHYSQAELSNLIVAAEKVCDSGESRKSPATTWLRRRIRQAKCLKMNGAPGEIRTPDLMVRSHALYPTELRARTEVAGGESRPSLKAAAGALTCVSRSRQRGHVWAETVPGAFWAARARDLFLSRISKLLISA